MRVRSLNKTVSQKELISRAPDRFELDCLQAFGRLFERSEGNRISGWDIFGSNGWHPLLWEMFETINDLLSSDRWKDWNIKFVQIKEKFGAGRFYFSVEPPFSQEDAQLDRNKYESLYILVDTIVSAYEELSDNICAISGEWYEEKVEIGGWIYDISPKTAQAQGLISEVYVARKEARSIKARKIERSLHSASDSQLDSIIEILNR